MIMVKLGDNTKYGKVTWIDNISEHVPDPLVKVEKIEGTRYRASELEKIPDEPKEEIRMKDWEQIMWDNSYTVPGNGRVVDSYKVQEIVQEAVTEVTIEVMRALSKHIKIGKSPESFLFNGISFKL